MSLFSSEERGDAEAIAGIAFGNPFLPERIEREKKLLDREFRDTGPVITFQPDAGYDELFPNVRELHRRAERLTEASRQRLGSGQHASDADLALYEDLVCYVLYNRHVSLVREDIRAAMVKVGWKGPVEEWPNFLANFRYFFGPSGGSPRSHHQPEHLFALLFQVARAFHAIFESIVGSSSPSARLRAAVWQSIFTHDMRRYMRLLYRQMPDIPTLITGPSGTGKELVVRAIGTSGFIPFKPGEEGFGADGFKRYSALNLSALSPGLIESELFGYVQGSFTDARKDRPGWLESGSTLGAIFLDEIGELDLSIQVKLLRVLQSREFHPVGSKETRPFKAKLIAATNRDLATEMRAGRFRQDFYYRLCADAIITPGLREQLLDRPDDLPAIVRYVVRLRVLRSEGGSEMPPADEDVKTLVEEVTAWIKRHLGTSYAWPGNSRELEQCVRSLMIRSEYQRLDATTQADPIESFLREVREGSLSQSALLGKYYAIVLARTESYAAAARRLGKNYRTVPAHIDREFYSRLTRH